MSDAEPNEISDDALSAFAAVVEDLSAQPEQLRALLHVHADQALAAKLPAELTEGDDAVLLVDPAWAKGLLDLARSLLVDEATRSEAARSQAGAGGCAMKFRTLTFYRFGAFADCTLDLGANGQNLHVIYGSNEAGKSTALKGIAYFLRVPNGRHA